jgi:tripartite-type tricarboxylate transporter receptor subunit TctC
MLDRRRFAGLAMAAALASDLPSNPAFARGWPSRPVRLIVPFAPGGSTDAMARIIANRLSEIWGQQMVVENRVAAAPISGPKRWYDRSPTGIRS